MWFHRPLFQDSHMYFRSEIMDFENYSLTFWCPVYTIPLNHIFLKLLSCQEMPWSSMNIIGCWNNLLGNLVKQLIPVRNLECSDLSGIEKNQLKYEDMWNRYFWFNSCFFAYIQSLKDNYIHNCLLNWYNHYLSCSHW